MSSISFTFLLAVSFILFARVNSNVPYWKYAEYRFSCVSVCSQSLMGDTYSCLSASGPGLAAGRVVVRILPNMDWRYYGIRDVGNSEDFCHNVWLADQFYSQGNGTMCNPIYSSRPKESMYNPGIKGRSEGVKRNEEDTKFDILFGSLEKITQLVKEIQKEALTTNESTSEGDDPSTSETDESSDTRMRRLSPNIEELINSVLGMSNVFDHGNGNPIKIVPEKLYGSAPAKIIEPLEDKLGPKQYTGRSYYKRSYQPTPGPYDSDPDDSRGIAHDPRADAMCLWASKAMCRNKRMVICTYGVCCWGRLNTQSCNRIAYDRGVDIYRHSIYSIIQSAKLQ